MSELGLARYALSEAEKEWKRINEELATHIAKRSEIIDQMAKASKRDDISELVKLMDLMQERDRAINDLTEQKRKRVAEKKKAQEQAKQVEMKANQLRQKIEAGERILGSDGELARHIRETETKAGSLRQLLTTAHEPWSPDSEMARLIREAEHDVEMRARLRESAERKLLGLKSQLSDLIGDA